MVTQCKKKKLHLFLGQKAALYNNAGDVTPIFFLFSASHQSWSPEHSHQNQHRAQQGMSDQHLQVQVLPGHQWSHYNPQKCQQHGEW